MRFIVILLWMRRVRRTGSIYASPASGTATGCYEVKACNAAVSGGLRLSRNALQMALYGRPAFARLARS
jgi:hypothetical protein